MLEKRDIGLAHTPMNYPNADVTGEPLMMYQLTDLDVDVYSFVLELPASPSSDASEDMYHLVIELPMLVQTMPE